MIRSHFINIFKCEFLEHYQNLKDQMFFKYRFSSEVLKAIACILFFHFSGPLTCNALATEQSREKWSISGLNESPPETEALVALTFG